MGPMDLGRVLGERDSGRGGGGVEMGGSDWGGKGGRGEWRRRIGSALGTGKRAEVERKLEFPRGAILAVRNGPDYRLSEGQRLRARLFNAWKTTLGLFHISRFSAPSNSQGPRHIFAPRLGAVDKAR